MQNLWDQYRGYIIALGIVLILMIAFGIWWALADNGVDVRVRRVDAHVWAGSGDGKSNLPHLDDDLWHELGDGDRVETDSAGQAVLDLDGCMSIYLFQEGTQLVKSGCPNSERSGGSVFCSVEGTSAYNNQCASQIIIESPSAEIQLQGTWLSLTYLPEEQLTFVLVSEGNVEVRPVLDLQQRDLGEGILVKEGYFLYTVPDANLNAIQSVIGLRPREVYPFEDFPNFIQQLSLETADVTPMIDGVKDQAQLDGVLTPPDSVSRQFLPEPIRIGLQSPLSGDNAIEGEGALQAVEMLVEQTNAAGGLLGRPVELIVVDDAGDPGQAKQAAYELVANGVVAVIGASGSDATEAAAAVYARAGVLHVASSATALWVNDAGFGQFFQVRSSDAQRADLVATLLGEVWGAKEIGLVDDGSRRAESLAELTKTSLEEMGLEVTVEQSIRPGDTDLGPALRWITEMRPQAVYFTGDCPDGRTLLRQSVEFQLDPVWVLNGDCPVSELLELAELGRAQGLFIISEPFPQDLTGSEAREFVRGFEERYGEPVDNVSWLMAAEAFHVIAFAVEQTGVSDPLALADFLHSQRSIPSLTGPISGWDERGGRRDNLYVAYELDESGRFVLYWGQPR